MVKQYDTATESALNAGKVDFRVLAELQLDDGTYRFGNHSAGELISVLGESWYGVGGLATISSLRTSSGFAADEASIKVNGSQVLQPPPGYEDTVSWFGDILKRNMVNRRCRLFELLLHTDTGEPLHADPVFAGPIDGTPLDPTKPEIVIRIRSNRMALTWPTGRTRSDADQRRVNETDGSLRHVGDVAARNGKMPWGFVPQNGGTRATEKRVTEAVRRALN